MYKINQEQFATLPDELKALYVKLPNPSSEEVRECFPETGKSKSGGKSGTTFASGGDRTDPRVGHDDNGGNASRFFKSIIYQAKASKSERNKGLEYFEIKQAVGGGGGIGDYLDDVNSASGKYGSEKAPAKNSHPCIKPIALMEYLIKMVTPKGGIVLDPFAGSGSTGVACIKNGFGFIGIEREEEYVKICKARMEEEQREKDSKLI